jgi:hypothetical protein
MARPRTPRAEDTAGTREDGAARRRVPVEARKVVGPGTVHSLRILLSESDPPIWRAVEVPSDIRLDRLHCIIQAAMGWCDGHPHQFTVEDECVADPGAADDVRDERAVRLHQIAPEKGSSFLYVYDFGDDWQHEITVEAVEPRADAAAHVRCTGGARTCPPEDCGGIPGYEDLLRVLGDPLDDEHAAMCELVGGRFDPEAFDLGAANRRIKQVR